MWNPGLTLPAVALMGYNSSLEVRFFRSLAADAGNGPNQCSERANRHGPYCSVCAGPRYTILLQWARGCRVTPLHRQRCAFREPFGYVSTDLFTPRESLFVSMEGQHAAKFGRKYFGIPAAIHIGL